MCPHADFAEMKAEEGQGAATVRPPGQAESLGGGEHSTACNGTLAAFAPPMPKAETMPAQCCSKDESELPPTAIRAAAALAATARAQAAAGTSKAADPGAPLIRRSSRESKSRIIMVGALHGAASADVSPLDTSDWSCVSLLKECLYLQVLDSHFVSSLNESLLPNDAVNVLLTKALGWSCQVDGHPVLRSNNYDLESGERSVFEMELNSECSAQFASLKSRREAILDTYDVLTSMHAGRGAMVVGCRSEGQSGEAHVVEARDAIRSSEAAQADKRCRAGER